jgi:hypothetical protein
MRELVIEELNAVTGGNIPPNQQPTVTVTIQAWQPSGNIFAGFGGGSGDGGDYDTSNRGDEGGSTGAWYDDTYEDFLRNAQLVGGSIVEVSPGVYLTQNNTNVTITVPQVNALWDMKGVVFDDIKTINGVTGYTDLETNRTWFDLNGDQKIDLLLVWDNQGNYQYIYP